MSAPESSETFGSRVLITLDSQSGTVLLSHCGSAFVGIFRAGDLSVDILHPAQNIFCAKEEGLPTDEAFDVPIEVRKNDIIFALLPSTAGWEGIKPVDLQGAMYGVEAGDTESFNDFVKNLPKVLKDFNCSLMICAVSDKAKGLCEPCKLMYSRSHKDSFWNFDGTSGGFLFPLYRPPTALATTIFGPFQRLEQPPNQTEPNFRSNFFTSSSSSSSSEDSTEQARPVPYRRYTPISPSRSTSSSSSSEDELGDYNYRSPRSSDPSSEIGEEDAYLPEQNQEADRGLNTIPGYFTGQTDALPRRPQWIQRRVPADVITQTNFPDLNEPIRQAPFRPPRAIPTAQSPAPAMGRGTARIIRVEGDGPTAGTGRGVPAAGRGTLSTGRGVTRPAIQATPPTTTRAGPVTRFAGRGTASLTGTAARTQPIAPSPRAARGRLGRTALQQRRAEEEEQDPQPETPARPREDPDEDENDRERKRLRR